MAEQELVMMRYLLLSVIFLTGCPAAHKYKQGDLVTVRGHNDPLVVENALMFHQAVVVVNHLGQHSTINESVLTPYVETRPE